MNTQDDDINSALSRAYEYLAVAIRSLTNDLKYAHFILSLIKSNTQEESDIYISSVSNPHSFIMLDIEYLFEKSRPSFNHIPYVTLHTRRTKIPTTVLVSLL